ncbi:MAG: hypothetical protein JW939_08540 [Candidatus Thermoplasmatota archaeon]|nr:hypothetical protein [Candidatus Thermoplasmatota archaeon]
MRHRALLTMAILGALTVSAFLVLLDSEDVSGLPDGYPISLSGGYSEEVPGTTTYVDHLQPGDTENYLVRLENPTMNEIRYRVSVSNIPEGWLVFLENGNQNMLVDMVSLETESIYLYIKNPKTGTADLLVNVTDEGSERFWTLTLQIICEVGPLVISVDSASFILGREVPALVGFEVENVGQTVLNVSLDIPGMVLSDEPVRDSWTVEFSERTFLLPPLSSRQVTATVRAPEFEPIGSQKIVSMEAEVQGISRPFASRSLTFRVQTIFDLRASVAPVGYQKVNPGTSVSFELLLENLASETDYVIISEFYTPGGWSIGFNDTIDPTDFSLSIDPESSRRFHPVVHVPPIALAGRQDIVMRATGTSNVTEFTLKVEVARRDAVEVVPTPPAGQDNFYRMTIGDNLVTFELWNKGNTFDTGTLIIENRPSWAPFVFHSVQVGGGSTEQVVSGDTVLNLSGAEPGIFRFVETDLETVAISLSPSQGARITIKTRVAMDMLPESGVVGIRYTYGQLIKQSFVQLSVKIIIVDLEIVDMDRDSIPDLKLFPEPDYDLNDRIYFVFSIRNDYPYPTREGDVKWRIKMAGTVILEGEVGVIEPGEEKEFNVSWKAEKRTRNPHFAYLDLYGSVYETEEQAPRAKSENEIFIGSGRVERSWGLMLLFLGFMVLIMVIFAALFISAQRNKGIREAEAKARYEEIYSRKGSPGLGEAKHKGLGEARRSGRPLPGKERQKLPPSGGKGGGKAEGKPLKKKDEEPDTGGITVEELPRRAPPMNMGEHPEE